MMLVFGFILGVLFCFISMAVSFWLSQKNKDIISLARKVAPRARARIVSAKTDTDIAREELIESHKDEGGARLEDLI